MRIIDKNQFKWLIILSVSASFTALLIDECVYLLTACKFPSGLFIFIFWVEHMKFKTKYWQWIAFGMSLVILA